MCVCCVAVTRLDQVINVCGCCVAVTRSDQVVTEYVCLLCCSDTV